MSSLFKRLGSRDSRTPSPSLGTRTVNPREIQSRSRDNHMARVSTGKRGDTVGGKGSDLPPVTRERSGTDPETCFMVYKSHWNQAWAIINKVNTSSPLPRVHRNPHEDVEAVVNYIDHMTLLLVEEESLEGGQGSILQYLLTEDILEKVLSWMSKIGEPIDRLRLHQLHMYECLISQSRQSLLIHKPFIRPLLKLLSGCREHPDKKIEARLILVLHQLCICLTRDIQLLELLFNASSDQGPAKFLMFSLLIPYVHREGTVGQQARDALLLIMALSSKYDDIGRYIAQNSDFCPVLATGLSGLYSSLPRKLQIPSDDWYQLEQEDINAIPDLVLFLNSLEFCNAVVQVAHPLVREQLLTFIYNGFLLHVMGPALHQSSMEEVIAATAYLELFIRRITESSLIQTFLQFIITETHDDYSILESLIQRINSNSRLCMVSLSLFKTLVDLNCEDVMFQLVYKYLIPCTHVMVSQRRAVKDLDLYSRAAEKLLSLTPACCHNDVSDIPAQPTSVTLAQDTPSKKPSPQFVTETTSPSASGQKLKRFFFKRKSKSFDIKDHSPFFPQRGSSPEVSSATPSPSTPTNGRSKPEGYDNSYMDYLDVSRKQIRSCAKACRRWTALYDGTDPSPDSLSPKEGATGDPTVRSKTDSSRSKKCLFNDPAKSNDALHDIQHAQKSLLTLHPSQHDRSKTDINRTETTTPTVLMQDQAAKQNGDNAKHNMNDQNANLTCDKVDNVQDPVENHVTDSVCPIENAVTTDSQAATSSQPHSERPTVSDTSRVAVVNQKESYADSTVSEADSGYSVCSSCTDSALPSSDQSVSRSDSPLNDQPNNADFNAFLLQLKRIDTPVETCDNVEESFHELDQLFDNFKSLEPRVSATSTKRPGDDDDEGLANHVVGEQSAEPETDHTKAANKDTSNNKSHKTGAKEEPAMRKTPGHDRQKENVLLKGAMFTPTKYHLGTPDIGPFLSILLNKLDCMMQNSLYVNLLLTELISRLACYSQPLLRSFLLSTTLVFQPSVKSLVQVLGSVKHKVDCYSYTVKDFDELMVNARRFLTWREEVYLQSKGKLRSDSAISLPVNAIKNIEQGKEKKRGTLGDLFRRTPSLRGSGSRDWRLQMVDGRGFRYINRTSPPPDGVVAGPESVKTKNAVYCALILEEFVKELAALSQEHALLNTDMLDEGYNSSP